MPGLIAPRSQQTTEEERQAVFTDWERKETEYTRLRRCAAPAAPPPRCLFRSATVREAAF